MRTEIVAFRGAPASPSPQPSPIKGEGVGKALSLDGRGLGEGDDTCPTGKAIKVPALALVLAASILPLAALAAPNAAELEQAGNLFEITCSSSMCHGEGGVGARGPALRNRDLPADFVRNTMLQGRSGTPMPSFRDSLTAQEVNAIVSYVMSLSPGNQAAGDGSDAPPPATAPAAPLSEEAQAGSAIFFDETRASNCAQCHSYGGHGGPIGPDISSIAKKSPGDIYRAILHPSELNPDYPMVRINDRTGKTYVGVVKKKSKDVLKIYDLSSSPPVLRTFYDSDRVGYYYADGLVYRHDLSGYSKSDIASLIAFLKSAAGPSKDVTPQDFAQPEDNR